jgi:cell wall-associated NlpC family hydrolase
MIILLFGSCQMPDSGEVYSPFRDSALRTVDSFPAYADTAIDEELADEMVEVEAEGDKIDTRDVKPAQLVAFAQTLRGVPYRFGSTDPSKGFDCSGFITHVFNHFKIAVPRSSVDYTNVGREVSPAESRPGDLILFTGTDSTIPVVGHMGIVITNNNGQLDFIHSSSGKAYGVTTSPLEGYYRTRFVKVIRVFKD